MMVGEQMNYLILGIVIALDVMVKDKVQVGLKIKQDRKFLVIKY